MIELPKLMDLAEWVYGLRVGVCVHVYEPVHVLINFSTCALACVHVWFQKKQHNL